MMDQAVKMTFTMLIPPEMDANGIPPLVEDLAVDLGTPRTLKLIILAALVEEASVDPVILAMKTTRTALNGIRPMIPLVTAATGMLHIQDNTAPKMVLDTGMTMTFPPPTAAHAVMANSTESQTFDSSSQHNSKMLIVNPE